MVSFETSTTLQRIALGGILFFSLTSPGAAQDRGARWGDNSVAIEFTPRRTGDYNPNSDRGYCNIRLEVDDEVYVYIRGDRVRAERTRGDIPKDQGSECSGPLPGRYLRNFRWKGVDGRGEQRLIEQPGSGNNYTAAAYIRDSKGGREGYTFRIEWEGRGGSGGSGAGGGGGWGGSGGSGWGGSGGSGWGGGNNNFRAETRGNGTAYLQDDPDRRLNYARFYLNGNSFRMRLEGDQNIAITGRFNRRSDSEASLDIEQINNRGASGGGTISIRNNQIYRLNLSGNLDGRNYRLNFDGRF